MAQEAPSAVPPHTIAIPPAPKAQENQAEIAAHAPGQVQVIRRNGKVTHFDPNKIMVAMTKAFLAVEGGSAAASSRIHDRVETLTDQVATALTRRLPGGGTVHIEDIQDQVELALMRAGEHKVARDYVLYREKRARERAEKAASRARGRAPDQRHPDDGSTRPLDVARLNRLVTEACRGLDAVDGQAILDDSCRNLFDGVKEADVGQALVMSARAMIEKDPEYGLAAARLLLDILRHEALGFLGMAMGVETQADLAERYGDYFTAYIKQAADLELLDRRLPSTTLSAWGPPSSRSATSPSPTWACRPSTTATSSTARTACASSCPRPSSCAWPWAWPSTRSTARSGPSSSTNSCPPSTS